MIITTSRGSLERSSDGRRTCPEFTLETKFGDMVLHYTQIGKTWLEVCVDKDEDIFDSAIQPLWKLSGSFNILFNELDVEDLKDKVITHLKRLEKILAILL